MEIVHIELKRIKENKANPRLVKKEKFNKLVKSILLFPKMLEIRPLVVDDSLTILGGNMRYRALLHIEQMGYEEASAIFKGNEYEQKSNRDQEQIDSFWIRFFDNPTAPVCRASDLSDSEKTEFIIKDNVGFGEWDWDRLANEWDGDDLVDWGIDLWKSEETKQVKDLSEKLSECFKIEIDCGSETSQKELFNELEERGLKCRLLTL